MDKKYPSKPPLLSQNISIVDGAGSHSKIFANFIDFIGLKSLIITDIDTYYDEPDGDGDANQYRLSQKVAPIILLRVIKYAHFPNIFI